LKDEIKQVEEKTTYSRPSSNDDRVNFTIVINTTADTLTRDILRMEKKMDEEGMRVVSINAKGKLADIE